MGMTQRVMRVGVLMLATLTACATEPLLPITTGSHVKSLHPPSSRPPATFAIWTNHPLVTAELSQTVLRAGGRVIERAQLVRVFEEQRIRLTHTADDEADLLRVGRLVGAEFLIFAEAQVGAASPPMGSPRDSFAERLFRGFEYAGTPPGQIPLSARMQQQVAWFRLAVSVRSVNVETGEVRWTGSAYYPEPVTNPEDGLVYLTRAAVGRALCPFEDGATWSNKTGCSSTR